jgi:hypothetical protein
MRRSSKKMDVIRHPAVVDQLGAITVERAPDRPFEAEPIVIVEEEDFIPRRVLRDVVRKPRAEWIEVTPHHLDRSASVTMLRPTCSIGTGLLQTRSGAVTRL